MSFTEPHQGDGGLLRGSHETLRRPEDGAPHTQRPGLHRLHAHTVPELGTHCARRPPPRSTASLYLTH